MNTKILLCLHKPSVIQHSELFVPINVGRTILNKKRITNEVSSNVYEWMIKNTIGDDSGDNISDLNPFFCELTAVYWAWKNYDKLGNPEYIGLNHYRRVFDLNSISNVCNGCNEIIVPKPLCFESKNESIKEQFIRNHSEKNSKKLLDVVNKISPSYYNDTIEYFSQKEGYFWNIFIMKKDIFIEYSNFIFNILFEIHKDMDYSTYSTQQARMIGFMAERLTGAFLYSKIKNKINYSVLPVIFLKNTDVYFLPKIEKEKQDKHNVNICSLCLEGDIVNLETSLISLLENSIENDFLIFNIFIKGDLSQDKNTLKSLGIRYKNCKFNFIDISYLEALFTSLYYDKKIPKSIETLCHFFIPRIFNEYGKVIWIKPGMIFTKDALFRLYNSAFNDKLVIVARTISANLCLCKDQFNINTYASNPGIDMHNIFSQDLIVYKGSCNYKELEINSFEILKNDLKYETLEFLNLLYKNKSLYLDQTLNFECNCVNSRPKLSLFHSSLLDKAVLSPLIYNFANIKNISQLSNDSYSSVYMQYAMKSVSFTQKYILNNK